MKKAFLFLCCLCFSISVMAADSLRVRVLSIGNSFSRDAFSYVPFVIEELVPGVEVDFGILYIGGCTLQRHYENLVGEKPAYEFDFYTTKNGKWTMERDYSIQKGVSQQDWDIVIFQQQSAASRYYDTYQPYLNELLNYIQTAKPFATPAWLMTQAYGTGHKPLGDMSSDEMWARVNASSERVMIETKTKLLIPAGTAIQNARYTVLDRLGETKHLVNDGYHIQEGIPALIEALVTAQVVMGHYGIDVDVTKSKLKITPEWREERRTPQPNGKPEEATDAEYVIARRCAQWALEAPWQMTIEEE